MTASRAPFITIEGVDGAGKSSHLPTIVQTFRDAGFEVVETREPGGTPLGERLREEILTTPMALGTEVLLAFASRAEHLEQVIGPARALGSAVVCDRFTDSTYAYQGAGGGYPLDRLAVLEHAIVPIDQRPDLTLLFDLPVAESLRRLGGTGKVPDKFEGQGAEYFEKVRGGYMARVQADPDRFRVIDATPSIERVADQVRAAVAAYIDDYKAKNQPERQAPRPPRP